MRFVPKMLLTMFLLIWCVGCQLSPAEESVTETEERISSQPSEDIERIVVTFQTIQSMTITDLDQVVEAINAITIPLIGVEVEFRVVNSIDAFSLYPLWISEGEDVDLMILNYQDITTYISKEMLLPLNELLKDSAPAIQKVILEEGIDITEAAVIDDAIYGVANVSGVKANGGGVWIPERIIKETGLKYDPKHVYSLEELSMWFAAIKELYPDCYPLGLITSGNSFSTKTYFGLSEEAVGGESSSGTVLDADSLTIVNVYASEPYYDFLCYLREWYLAGYIYPDAAITNASAEELMREGLLLGFPLISSPGMGMEDNFGEKTVCLRTAQVTKGGQYAKSGFWVLPKTCDNPTATMKFLDLLYSDNDVGNLILWGIEGIHYQVVDRENGLIKLPEGKTMADLGYVNALGMYGDMRKHYKMSTLEREQELAEYEAEGVVAEQRTAGFTYSSIGVAREIDEIQKVVDKYVPILESGSVDIDRYYPEFLGALEQAGIGKVIADKQEQLDQWLSQQ